MKLALGIKYGGRAKTIPRDIRPLLRRVRRRGGIALVKGMTRRIIEIRQTGNIYFEKAVFYCRTNMPRRTSEETLAREASRIIDRLCDEGISLSGKERKPFRRKLSGIARMLLSAAAGALAMFCITRFL